MYVRVGDCSVKVISMSDWRQQDVNNTMNPMFRSRLFIIGCIVLLSSCTAVPPDGNGASSQSAAACTLEAKLCPDGSAVGRVPPSCEFAPCPGEGASSDQTQNLSDGIISFTYAPEEFGLAISEEQILVESFIPPCESGFTYCLYYNGSAYEGTNFDAAGLGITKRPELSDEDACLQSLPAGYSGITPVVRSETGYATSVFAPLGNAAAGHFTHEELYRLHVGTACYEFRIRVGQAQFANYEPGTVEQFTDEDETELRQKLLGLLENITLADGTDLLFPQSSNN